LFTVNINLYRATKDKEYELIDFIQMKIIKRFNVPLFRNNNTKLVMMVPFDGIKIE